ncbi:protein HGH1 homolog [Sycon ciliatum]|uniref:protein HGH1 homolog n=1 Tax=Sycon ciliatum TaxID=27933 RepID=UPI0031F6D2C8
MADLDELIGFLVPNTPSQIQDIALDYVVGLTASADGFKILLDNHKVLFALLDLLEVDALPSKDLVFRALVNMSADAALKRQFTSQSLETLLDGVLSPGYVFADGACMILCNVTREEAGARMLWDIMARGGRQAEKLAELVDAFCNISFNTVKGTLDYAATLLSNVTQVPEARLALIDKQRCLLQRLLPFTGYQASKVRRGGIIGVVRNCCIDPACHDWLLGEDVSLLSHLLLPLAGPEEYSDEEMDKLPVDLQFLEPSKTREEDASIRKMLIEAINQLCSTRAGREVIKSLGTYYVMRELYNWEKDAETRLTCRKLIDLLISDEPETGMENLRDVDVPADVQRALEEQDAQMLEDFKAEVADDGAAAAVTPATTATTVDNTDDTTATADNTESAS